MLYECPYKGTAHILVIRHALYVESMTHNLIPPFILREAGIVVNERPKIQTPDPSVEDHSIYFENTKLRIPLCLNGTFSYFPTTKPSIEMLQSCEEVLLLTPSRWNPHDNAYALNEEGMIDWQGELVEKKDRRQILLSEVAQDDAMAASTGVSSVEASVIDAHLERRESATSEWVVQSYPEIPKACDQVASVLADVDPCLNDHMLYQ